MAKYKDNPWLGLESYQENQKQKIYGRNTEIEELSQCVLNNRETVLYGKSGIGKSSIINAGIIPVLRAHGYIPVVVRLDHSNKYSYIKQLSDSITSVSCVSECTIDKPIEEELLWEYFHSQKFNNKNGARSKLVVIFDQFEEIFTLQTNSVIKSQFFAEFGDVLNDVMPKELVVESQQTKTREDHSDKSSKKSVSSFVDMADLFSSLTATLNNTTSKYIEDNEINFVFILREDFISEFEYFTSKIPSLKQHRYGLRPLNEEQAAEIIMKPRPELVDIDVARSIIETVTGRTDFMLGDEPEIDVDAAVLSLFLNQIYDKRETEYSPISIDMIETFGKDIIKDFYEEAVARLSSLQIDFLEDELLTGENRRDSLSKSDFKAGGFSDSELKYLIVEKKILRQFHYEGDLRVELIHDILCPVIKERKEKREQLRIQEEERRRQEDEKQRVIAEEQRKREEIEHKAAAEKAELEAEAMRTKRRNRKRLTWLSLVIVVILSGVFGVYLAFYAEYSENYGNFTTKDGWPIGLGEEINSSKTKETCTVYYKLSREGYLPTFSFLGKKYKRPFTKVEILNWDGKPTTNVFVESPAVSLIDKELNNEKAAAFAELQSKTSYWIFMQDENGQISRRTAYSIDNKELYSEEYSTDSNGNNTSNYVSWSIFKDKNGKSLQINDNGTDRIRFTISGGLGTGCSFFTQLGTPQPNTSGCYGYSFDNDSVSNQVTSRVELDKFGRFIANTEVKYNKYENGRCIETSKYKVTYSKQQVLYRHKEFTDTLHISSQGFVDKFSIHVDRNDFSHITLSYNGDNNLLLKKLLLNNNLVYKSFCSYSAKLDSINIFDVSSQPKAYTKRYMYPKNGCIEESYWVNNRQIELPTNDNGDIIKCHKKQITEVPKADSIYITTSFFDVENRLTKNGLYAKKEIILDSKTHQPLYEYYYDATNEICKSEMYTYNKYGIIESRSVAGIDKTPVRCPNWDWDSLTYYKMIGLKDFCTNSYVAVSGINEFGEETYIVGSNGVDWKYSEEPLYSTLMPIGDRGYMNSLILSKHVDKSIITATAIPYLHVLNKESVLYRAKSQDETKTVRDGLYDNDILYRIGNWELGLPHGNTELLINEWYNLESNGGIVEVLRIVEGKYKKLSYTVSPGELKAEYHMMPLTDIEVNHLKLLLMR